MQAAIRTQARVLPGNRLEITDAQLPEGQTVEVIVLLPVAPAKKMSMLDYLQSLPSPPGLFKTAEEVDRYIQEERNSWDR